MFFNKVNDTIVCKNDTETGLMISVLDSVGTPAIISDIESSEIKFLNKSAKKTFGINHAVAAKMSDFFADYTEYNSILSKVKKGKEALIRTKMHTVTGNKIHVEGSSKPITHEGKNYKLTVLKDLTAEKEFEYLATTDALTGINNRYSIMKKAEEERKRHQRYNRAMSVLVIDIDHFKKINDRHGHKAGDMALKTFAHTVDKLLRNVDSFGRIGGEEFVVLLPETDEQKALYIAERIRKAVENMTVLTPNSATSFEITTSIGVSAINHRDISIDDVIDRADSALYRAKEKGRNKVAKINYARMQMAC